MVKTNSIKAWFLAARPKTLTAAAVPVMLGIVLALKQTTWLNIASNGFLSGNEDSPIRLVPALLCLLFAWVMQIDSNLVNDYFDYKNGNDDETRLGPKRACAEGWITLPAMKMGIIITTLLGCCIGLPLALYGDWEMIIVGVCCVIFCFLYTTCLSYLGLGDLLVLVFFGIVPVCCTYYLAMPEMASNLPNAQLYGNISLAHIPAEVILASIACGLVVDTLLIVNNYRDYDNDIKAGKKTLVVHIGKRGAEWLYCVLGNLAMLIMMGIVIENVFTNHASNIFLSISVVYLILHNLTFKVMRSIGKGKALNRVLGLTARNIFVFGIISCLMILGLYII